MDSTQKYDYIPLKRPTPITEQDWPEGTLPLVHTRTMTFMHENYIRECIEGILKQKTTFPVQVLIHDDASSDKTVDIIQEYEQKYPQLIKVFYQKENSHSKPDKNERRAEFWSWRIGKYETICEGDDYWIDPLKLQKQIEFMEAHPEYGVTATSAYMLIDKTGKIKQLPLFDAEYRFEDFVLGNRISNLTSCIRMELLWQYLAEIKPENRAWKSGDYPMWLYLSKVSIIKHLPFRSAVYRVLEESASHSKDKKRLLDFNRYHHSMRKFYLDYFQASDELYRKVDIISYRESSTLAIITKNFPLCKEIYDTYIANGYNVLAQLFKIKRKFPKIIRYLDILEKVLIKVGIIKLPN